MVRRQFLPTLVLLAITLTYANSFGNSFHFDDFHTITDNPAIRTPVHLRRIFADTTAFSVLPANQTYRPLVTASLALDYALGRGYVPFWFHLSTFLWFLLLVILLRYWFQWLLDRTEPQPANALLALGAAAWFGLHPAMAETVNYVIQRGDLYATLGCVAALYVHARYPCLRRYGAYLLPFVLAMFSKPPAAVFPLLLGLQVFFFEATAFLLAKRIRTSLLAATPALIVAAALLWLQSAMTPRSYLPSILSPAAYRLTQPFVWLRYAGALVLPLHLNVDTDLQAKARLDFAAIAGLVFVLVLLGMIALTARRRRLYLIAFGLLWFLITQLPTSVYPLSEVENDHRMFLSFPGLIVAVVWALHLLYRRVEELAGVHSALLRQAVGVAAMLVLCGYAYGAHRRNEVWRTEDSLWADDVAKSPHNGRGLMIYGLTRMNAGDLQGASALFQRALVYTPYYPTLEINLGVVNGLLAQQGRVALEPIAEQHFQRALSLAPGDDTAHAYYGRWLLGQGRLLEATGQLEAAVALNSQRTMQRDLLLQAYRQAGNTTAARSLATSTLALVPGDAEALAALYDKGKPAVASPAGAWIEASLASYRAGKFQQSIEEAKQAVAKDAQSAEAWNNVGAGYGALQAWDAAIAAEQKAVALNPDLQIAQNNLRWFVAQKSTSTARNSLAKPESAADLVNLSLALHQQGRYEASREAARKALALDPHSAEAWNNVAADEEALEHWDAAIAAAGKAIALRPDFQLARNNLAWSLAQREAAAKH